MPSQNDEVLDPQPPTNTAFVIFNSSFQAPKQETTDGRFPPSYEQATGISAGPSSGNIYSSTDDYSAPYVPPYSTWVNPDAQRVGFSDNIRRSIYSTEPEPSETYLSASSVNTRVQLENPGRGHGSGGASLSIARAIRFLMSLAFICVFCWIVSRWILGW